MQNNTTRSVTKEDLIRGFYELGIRPGMAVEVHCSLSSFGYVAGGASAVIESLFDTVGSNGTIIMPSLRLSPNLPLDDDDRALGLVSKIRILPPDNERSAMGIVADTFRRLPGVCTGDGVFRVSAWGKDAAAHAKGLRYLIDTDGWALLLGVDIYKLTAMHSVEDILPDGIKDIFRPTKEAGLKYPEDEWLIEGGEPPVKPWYTIQERAYHNGMIKEGMIGNCKCMFFKVRDVTGLYREALEQDPYALYGIE